MKPEPTSLADLLRHAVERFPAAPALLSDERNFSYRDLCAAAQRVAAASGQNQAAQHSGSALDLALGAYAHSFENRSFWPVHRSTEQNTPLLHPEVALIISTSGSEGQPRAAQLSNAQLSSAAKAANLHLDLKSGDVWLNCLPLYHIGGQSILWRCALAGATVVLHEGFEPDAIARDFARHAITHISLVPAMLARLLDAGIAPPPSLRCAMIGGAALSLPLYQRGVAAGWPLRPSYGMSETGAQIATWQPDDGPWHEGLVGRVMPGHEIAIAADGRIRLRGPQLMLGYVDGSGLDADGWFTTGDLGRLDAEGRLTVLGRADDMLISGGKNVHPLEVESCLAACPGVIDVAVTGRPDPVWGDLVVALVVGHVDIEELLAHAREHLHSAALPRRVLRLDRLPRNATGKLERTTLRQLAREAEA
ncbi:class I adenylate-forming enzyme family protein [Azonexus sp. IMCC34839]|uniref:class I adenylate-forming enzyme family protein n=1 Tax=Azonexus sp. IMCC34839 TaxID=3133695 RepID=UPI00399BAFC4